MVGAYFEPRIGTNYGTTNILILSESAYSWQDEDGNVVDPSPSHPTENLHYWGIDRFGEQPYYRAMGRALSRTKKPLPDELKRSWDQYAYTIFVQGTVGVGPKSRPSKKQWLDAGTHFLSLIEQIRPLKVIVTGKTMWNRMPECTGPHLCDDLQAYKLSDGNLVWCLAIPHPSNRKKGEGFQWEWVGRSIHAFRLTKFPLREN